MHLSFNTESLKATLQINTGEYLQQRAIQWHHHLCEVAKVTQERWSDLPCGLRRAGIRLELARGLRQTAVGLDKVPRSLC